MGTDTWTLFVVIWTPLFDIQTPPLANPFKNVNPQISTSLSPLISYHYHLSTVQREGWRLKSAFLLRYRKIFSRNAKDQAFLTGTHSPRLRFPKVLDRTFHKKDFDHRETFESFKTRRIIKSTVKLAVTHPGQWKLIIVVEKSMSSREGCLDSLGGGVRVS